LPLTENAEWFPISGRFFWGSKGSFQILVPETLPNTMGSMAVLFWIDPVMPIYYKLILYP
jgi:hypothetical protein